MNEMLELILEAVEAVSDESVAEAYALLLNVAELPHIWEGM